MLYELLKVFYLVMKVLSLNHITNGDGCSGMSLNPYSNGICSTRGFIKSVEEEIKGLNPYSNGICSTSL